MALSLLACTRSLTAQQGALQMHGAERSRGICPPTLGRKVLGDASGQRNVEKAATGYMTVRSAQHKSAETCGRGQPAESWGLEGQPPKTSPGCVLPSQKSARSPVVSGQRHFRLQSSSHKITDYLQDHIVAVAMCQSPRGFLSALGTWQRHRSGRVAAGTGSWSLWWWEAAQRKGEHALRTHPQWQECLGRSPMV